RWLARARSGHGCRLFRGIGCNKTTTHDNIRESNRHRIKELETYDTNRTQRGPVQRCGQIGEFDETPTRNDCANNLRRLCHGWLAALAEEGPIKRKPMETPDTVSPQTRGYLESLPDPASLPAWPAADDSAGWKRLWQAAESASEPRVKFALKRFDPAVVERKI